MSTSELDEIRPGQTGPVHEPDVVQAGTGEGSGSVPSYGLAGSAAGTLRFLRSELRLVFRRRRNIALLGALPCAPILLGIAVRASAPGNGEAPPFLSQVTENGLFL